MNLNSLNILSSKPLAFDLSLDEWRAWCQSQGLATFVGKQIFLWIFQKGTLDPEEFSNISKEIRLRLKEKFSWNLPLVDSHLCSKDGSEKLLIKDREGNLFEMVLMPYEERVTLCLSSQVGCKRGCTFCQTGRMGLKRNLSSGEILSQILLANYCLKGRRVTNVVFMGMGEPLDNFDEVVKACQIMIHPDGFGLSKQRVTISTSGLAPEIDRLGEVLPVRLAISLHSADDERRSRMMPVNRQYNLATLKESLLRYPAPHRLGITFEYVMIEGENDSIQDAKKLVKYLSGIRAKVNLIPINHFPGLEMKASQADSLRAFQRYLADRSIPAPVRYSRGQDISGGCGQLAAKREEEIHLDPRELHRQRRRELRKN